MKRLQEFIRKLFSLRNLAPLIVIIGAIVGSLGLTPFGIQFSTDQIILALLAFLAIDSLVERLDILAGIKQGVQIIQKKLTSKVRADAFLKRRKNLPRMEKLINEARNEIWIAGITLDTMVTITGTFESKMKQECNLRFLAPTPDSEALQATAEYFGLNYDCITARIRSNLITLTSRLKTSEKSSIEIRVLDRVFPTGYFIIDPNSHKAQMIVQLYLYHIHTDEAPLFELSKTDDEQWFSIYMRQYEKAWDDAKVITF